MIIANRSGQPCLQDLKRLAANLAIPQISEAGEDNRTTKSTIPPQLDEFILECVPTDKVSCSFTLMYY
jgi:hypothetical protein